MMKKIFLFFGILASLSLHAVAWGDRADNGVDCTVVMEKTEFDARAAFPDFTLVFTNKGEKTVRLFDDFYPLKKEGPNISIEIWDEKRFGGKISGRTVPIARYVPRYKIERAANSIRFITLKPGEKHEVSIKDAYLLMHYFGPFRRLLNGQKYVLEVSFRDGYAEPSVWRKYIGKKEFQTTDQTPRGN